MYYYEVQSDLITLDERNSFVSSECELNEFDILLIDADNCFVTCRIVKSISDFEAVSKPFDIGTYINKTNVQKYLKEKIAKRHAEEILNKAEKKVKEIQFIEKLRKYSDRPEVKTLLSQYDELSLEKKQPIKNDNDFNEFNHF